MKKYLLGLIFGTGFCLAAQAQSSFYLGPTGGLGYTVIKNTSKSSGKLAANAGLAMVYNLSENFGIGLDAKYSVEGEKTSLNNIKYARNLNYFRVPLKAIYYFYNEDRRVTPKIFAGPSFGFLTGGKIKVIQDNDTKVYKSTDMFKSFDFGINAGAGLNYALNDNTFLTGDVSYYHGISTIQTGTREHNRNMMLNVGVLFGL